MISNFLPAYSGNIVPWGNKFFDIFGNDKVVWQKLIANELDQENEYYFLRKKGIKFILIDDLSRKHALRRFYLKKRDYLKKVFEKGQITIWQINNPHRKKWELSE